MLFGTACQGRQDTGQPTVDDICANETRVDEQLLDDPRVTPDGAFIVTLIQAEPDPPEKATNTWGFSITTIQGDPIPDASLQLTPVMPDHGHGTSPKHFAAVYDDASDLYLVDGFSLSMAGFWEVTATVANNTEPGSEQADTAFESAEIVFALCVSG